MLIRFAQYVLRQFLALGQLSIALGGEPMHPVTAGTAGAIGGSTNIFSLAAICRRWNRCPPPPFGTA